MADLSSLLGAAGIGGAIGKAIVSLELDTKKYTAEMEAAHAKTAATTNSMGSSVSKFGSLASTALLGAGVAAVAFGAYSVKAAIEANDAQLKLQNTFANNPKLADSSAAAFTRQADALRDLTGTDDEAIVAGQALLGSFKLTGEQVMALTPAVVDLAAKYDIDLQTAFKAVGKATAGNAGILSRYGVTIDEAKLKADAFGATLHGLGVAQGFAADRAEAEPWRVIGAQFEEIAERLGLALIPLLKNLADAIGALMPVIEGLIIGFIQLGHWIGNAIDKLGEFYDLIGRGVPVTEEMVDVIGRVAKPLLDAADAADKAGDAVQGARHKIAEFAHMTGKDLKAWSDKTKESFETYVINLDKVQEETDFTRKDLRDSFRAMLEHARDLNQAMRTLSREHWINDDFVKFLAEQPDKLILFANSNEEQQHRMQSQWQRSGDILHNQINDRLDVMTDALKHLDNTETKHHVQIYYEYIGFDPSKPGMGHDNKKP